MTKISLSCDTCGRPFERNARYERYASANSTKSRKGVFCSANCKNLSEQIDLPEGIAEEYLRGDSCKTIGERYGCSWSTIRNRLIDKGIEMRSGANSGSKNGMFGRTHTPEAKEKIRQANKRQFSRPGAREAASRTTVENLQSGKLKRTSTIEGVVAAILDEMGIEYIAQKAFRDDAGRFYASADFFLPVMNIALEVNGTYWHADPRVYPHESINATQQHNLKAYERKKTMYALLGIRLAEVWEKDIQIDARNAVQLALS